MEHVFPAWYALTSGCAEAAPRIDCIGPLNVDLIMRGRAPTEIGELVEWVGPSKVELLVAGSIGYTVQVLAQLGCAVRVISIVGDDSFGSQIVRELTAMGVDISGVQMLPGVTSIAIYPLLFGGAKRPMTYRLSPLDPWPRSLPVQSGGKRPDALLLGGLLHFPQMYRGGMAEVFAQARAAGVLTALDPQFPLTPTQTPWLPHISDVLGHTDVFFCDEHEASSIFCVGSPAEAAAAAIRRGCRIAAVKLGAQGAVIADASGVIEQPAVRLGQTVDGAVGAGDAFDAGFLAALLRGADPARAAREATATAACRLLTPDGARAIDRAAVDRILPSVPAARSAKA